MQISSTHYVCPVCNQATLKAVESSHIFNTFNCPECNASFDPDNIKTPVFDMEGNIKEMLIYFVAYHKNKKFEISLDFKDQYFKGYLLDVRKMKF